MNRPTTFAEACQITGIDPNILPDVSMVQDEGFQKYLLACYKLPIIAKALNGDWQADFANHDQYKYTPWFYVKKDQSHPSGVGFSCHSSYYWYAITSVGSRLCYKDSDTAEYAGETFLDLYRDHQLI